MPPGPELSWHSGNADTTPFYEALLLGSPLHRPELLGRQQRPLGLDDHHPKEYPGVVCAAAVDKDDAIADFSSRGPATYKGQTIPKPEWAAPGVDVISAKPGGGYVENSGTSMAAPHAAGAIALLLEARPVPDAGRSPVDPPGDGQGPRSGRVRLHLRPADDWTPWLPCSAWWTAGRSRPPVTNADGGAGLRAACGSSRRTSRSRRTRHGAYKVILPRHLHGRPRPSGSSPRRRRRRPKGRERRALLRATCAAAVVRCMDGQGRGERVSRSPPA